MLTVPPKGVRAMGKTLAAWLLMAVAAAAPTMTPRDVVQSAVMRVLQTIEDTQPTPQSARPSPEKARLEIRRIATDLFDFDEVSRRALSRHWAARSSQEQAEFISLFTDLLERSYVGKIESYSGEKIVYTGELVDGDYATVRSRVVSKRRTETALDYRLHRTGGRWKVYDVLIDGVSFVSTYRSEFNRIIQSSSWDDLMDRLRKKRIEIRTVVDRKAS
ncbi:MAG TPA: ABC transporter substrate-binding protein [Methylomirabilota bacterium]|jgi:phospholipid transport system substrate-binding protein|nr:ABC transporter substrate-binding protein [Methylomirabilota bacterium]